MAQYSKAFAWARRLKAAQYRARVRARKLKEVESKPPPHSHKVAHTKRHEETYDNSSRISTAQQLTLFP